MFTSNIVNIKQAKRENVRSAFINNHVEGMLFHSGGYPTSAESETGAKAFRWLTSIPKTATLKIRCVTLGLPEILDSASSKSIGKRQSVLTNFQRPIHAGKFIYAAI